MRLTGYFFLHSKNCCVNFCQLSYNNGAINLLYLAHSRNERAACGILSPVFYRMLFASCRITEMSWNENSMVNEDHVFKVEDKINITWLIGSRLRIMYKKISYGIAMVWTLNNL